MPSTRRSSQWDSNDVLIIPLYRSSNILLRCVWKEPSVPFPFSPSQQDFFGSTTTTSAATTSTATDDNNEEEKEENENAWNHVRYRDVRLMMGDVLYIPGGTWYLVHPKNLELTTYCYLTIHLEPSSGHVLDFQRALEKFRTWLRRGCPNRRRSNSVNTNANASN